MARTRRPVAAADEELPLPAALVLLPPDTWTEAHREALQGDVFGPVDARRRWARYDPLSAEEREQLLIAVRLALAPAYPEEGWPGKPEIKKRREALQSTAKNAKRLTAAIEQLPVGDQHRVSVLTFSDAESLEGPTRLIRALRALEQAATQLEEDVCREPHTGPRERLRRLVVEALVSLFGQFTGTKPTRVVDPVEYGDTGRLAQCVRALVPPHLHDDATGLDRQLRRATMDARARKKPRAS